MATTIKSLNQQVTDFIWGRPIDAMSKPEQFLITVLRITHVIIRDISEGQLTLRAMGLVYTTLLAMVPLIAVSFSVLKGFGADNQVEPALLSLLEPLGDKGVEITNKVVDFVNNINFVPIDWSQRRGDHKTLIVGDHVRIPASDSDDENQFRLIKEINYLNGNPAFRVIEIY